MTSKVYRVLIFSPTPTYPADFGNRKRIFSVCNWLTNMGAEVHFAYYPFESDWRLDPSTSQKKKMEEQWDYFDIVPASRSNIQTTAEDYYHTIDEWWDPTIENYISWKTSQFRFDAVIVNYPFFSKVFEYVPYYCFKILDAHDRFSNRRELLESMGVEPEFFYTDELNEKLALERADLVWAIKDEERDFYRTLTQKPVVKSLIHAEVTQTPLDIELIIKRVNRQRFLKVGFIGASNSINISNIERFLKIAIPIFKKNLTPVEFIIAGSICDSIQNLSSKWVKIVGRVTGVEEFYKSVDLVVVPMDLSTGLKIKVGEALSYGAPLICHSHAFEGYPVTHDCQILNTFEEVAKFCVMCAFSPSLLKEISEASIASYQKTLNLFDKSLLKSLELMNLNSPNILVKIDNLAFNKNDVRYYKALSILSILAKRCSITLFLTACDKITEQNEIDLDGDSLVVCGNEESFDSLSKLKKFDVELNLDDEQILCKTKENKYTGNLNFINNISWRFPFDFKSVSNEGAIFINLDNESINKHIVQYISSLTQVRIYRLSANTLLEFSRTENTWFTQCTEISRKLNMLPKNIAGVLTISGGQRSAVLELIERSNIPFWELYNYDGEISKSELLNSLQELLLNDKSKESVNYFNEKGWQWLWDILDDVQKSNKLNQTLSSLVD